MVTALRKSPPVAVMRSRRYVTIDSMAVDKKYQRSGVGKSLIKKVQQWALSRGVTRIELNVWEFNSQVMAFYKKLGFAITYRRMGKTLKQRDK
ncbi:GNAT family N-acetyltransferase [Elusimicrobiota bacterium]